MIKTQKPEILTKNCPNYYYYTELLLNWLKSALGQLFFDLLTEKFNDKDPKTKIFD